MQETKPVARLGGAVGLVLLASAAMASELSADEKAALESIRASTLMPTIRFLSADVIEGRKSGLPSYDIAAQYAVSRFQAAGLEAGAKEGFQQPFDLRWRVLGKEVAFDLTRERNGAKVSRQLEVRRDFIPLGFSEQGVAEGEIVFAGYGLVAPEWGWDDYQALGPGGARGKIVLVFRHEPDEMGEASSSRFEGREMSLASSLRQKVRNAVKAGAAGLILVDDPIHHEVNENPSSGYGGWRSLTDEERAKPADDPVRFRGRAETRDAGKPLGLVAMHASQELLRWLDSERDWKALQRDLDAGKRPVLRFPGVKARMEHRWEASYRSTSNVLAVVRGSDPELSKEYVIVGGHLDHEGKDEKTGEIYNGADDNASGSAAVIAVAEAFARMPKKPARSVMFALWGAEEMGLLGSDWFVHHPPVELDRIVAGINMDMVGRNEEKEMSVVGRPETPDLVALFDRFGPEVGFTLNDDAGAGASRSDNGSLWQAGIPTASLFSGTHEDYHEPGDDANKVLPGKVERAARLAFLVANEIAQSRATPKPLVVPGGPWTPIAPASRLSAKPAVAAPPSKAPARRPEPVVPTPVPAKENAP